jgi:homocysteine S-methyltransferase
MSSLETAELMLLTMTPIQSITDENRPLVLDGGLGSELASRGHDVTSALWSAELIMSQPQAIVDVHRAYLDAGARCIISASYQASIPGLEAAGYDAATIESVFADALVLARRARDEYLLDNPDCAYSPLIAASIGPYGAYLADGSEYRGNYGIGEAALKDFHAPRLRWLDNGGADLLACETIPDLQEAKVLSELLNSASTPAWVSFCCRDDEYLHDGNRLVDAVRLFDAVTSVIAIGVNCCAPEHVSGLIARLRSVAGDRRIVVYPNSGAQYDAERKCWYGQESAQQWAQQASVWYRAGADVIGGCCRIGPEHIQQLAKSEVWPC